MTITTNILMCSYFHTPVTLTCIPFLSQKTALERGEVASLMSCPGSGGANFLGQAEPFRLIPSCFSDMAPASEAHGHLSSSEANRTPHLGWYKKTSPPCWPYPADLYLDFFLGTLGRREPEGCEALKSTKKSEPIFLKSVMGDDLMGDQVPGGE